LCERLIGTSLLLSLVDLRDEFELKLNQ